jgi:NAD(P)-dependent dehydrogenase (short-subunit alcohol dehydrogenase family)
MVALDMDGRVVLITGAAKGIGAATADAFARAGARLALCDRDPIVDRGPDALCGRLDVRDPAAVDEFVTWAATKWGRIDVLVNNAGGTFGSPFLTVSQKGETALIAENFTQATHLIRAVAPVMGRDGAIVNVTSIEAHRAGPGYAVYAAMKAAIDSLTKSLALELAPAGIRVNAVAPDVVGVDLVHREGTPLPSTGVPYRPSGMPPVGRWGSPEEVASVILFLASPLASFVTGATVPVDGGNHAAGGWHRTDLPG